MSMAKTVVGRPVTFLIAFILLIGLGFFALTNLPVDLFPEINPPYIVVFTTYSGAGPEEVERTITRPMEQALSGVSALEKVTSSSSKGSSQILMQFTYGTDLIDAANSVRDALERVRRALPDSADSPVIFRMDPSMMPIISYRVSSDTREAGDLYDIVNDTISTRMEQSPGVASATVNGGKQKIICVDFPESRLEAYNLTVTQIKSMIDAQNIQVAAGTIEENNLSFLVNTMGQYTSIDEIRNTVISYVPNSADPASDPIPVFLKDIANIYTGYDDISSYVYVNGKPAISVQIQKQSGKNSVQVVDELRSRIPAIQAAVPQDIIITEMYSSTDQIKSTLNAVIQSAFSGVILAVLVLFLFLRSVQPALIIGLSIPISIIITIMLMYFTGLTLNLMTLAGLYLGLGMLVDNSIVILENILHYREKGAKLKPAALLGTNEMIVAITASTLTTICVFAPLIMFQSMLEMAGEMFFGLAFTIVISLVISLATAVFLVPVLASHFLPVVTRRQRPLTGRLAKLDAFFEDKFTKLDRAYESMVRRILRHKLITIGGLGILFLVSVFAATKVGYVFIPEQKSDSVTISMTLPLGTPIEETRDQLMRMQDFMKEEVVYEGKPAYRTINITAGSSGWRSSASNQGSVQVTLPKYAVRKVSDMEVQAMARRHFSEFPGATFKMSTSSGMGGGGGGMGGNPVDIMISIDDLKHGKEIAEQIVKLLKDNVPEALEPQIDLKDGVPQYDIVLDRDRMYALGLNAYSVGYEIQAAVSGLDTSTKYSENGTDYDITLRYEKPDRTSRVDLEHIFGKSTSGQRIPVSSFAGFEKNTGPVTINRQNQSRVIHITADKDPSVSLDTITSKIERLINANIPAEDGVVIEMVGDSADLARIMKAFVLIIVVAIFLVFGVMAALFESFKDPFIIIFTMPLSFIGIVAIYLITGATFNMLTAVGLLVLVGVIVNNGIVLVDYTNLLRKRGVPLIEACVQAAGNRLRPILMSTLTTVLGLAPLAFFPGEGTEMVAPIGKTVFGGLTFGTIMTLFLMPTIYAVINKNDDARRAKSQARREGLAAGIKGKDLKKLKQEAAAAGPGSAPGTPSGTAVE